MVLIRADYEWIDLWRSGDVRQDLVCLCRTEKVKPTLVFGHFEFAYMDFLHPLDIVCLTLSLQGPCLGQVKLYW